MTPASNFRVDNPSFSNVEPTKHPYYHLYMLVEDHTPSRFTYLNGIATGISRAMNLTPFLQMPRSDLQLIVIQTQGKKEYADAQKFLEEFKAKGFLAKDARIITVESYVYNQTLHECEQYSEAGRIAD